MYGRADGMPSFQLTVAVCACDIVLIVHIVKIMLAKSTLRAVCGRINHGPIVPFERHSAPAELMIGAGVFDQTRSSSRIIES
jgi:hypothetical protein